MEFIILIFTWNDIHILEFTEENAVRYVILGMHIAL